ncbi:MAG: aminoacyl-tRNA hydrolase [Candidatus Aminicenantales bacterium]
MWLVVGLGNPGEEYAATRHNVGFLLVRRVARSRGVELRGRAFKARTAVVQGGDEDVLLALPQTFMNRSGVSVREILAGRDISAGRLVVAYDDLDIRLGEIRVRAKGSPGTHKGMKSIVEEIRTREFPRIRIGIGPLPEGRDAAAYVLSPFGRDERPLLENSLDEAEAALDLILAGGTDKAMARFNRRNPAA